MKNYNIPEKHLNHQIHIQLGPYGPHYAKMICKKCNKFVKWATRKEYKIYKEITND